MARMHSRKKGVSGSTIPVKKVPTWAPFKGKEVEKLILKYSKAGKTSSEIGIILRDSYGIHSVKALTEKKITQILEENGMKKNLPEDLLNLIERLVAIQAHREKNNHDMTAKRGDLLTTSKIRRLVKYYKKAGKIEAKWNLDFKRLKMYLD
ncbi:30S ribosomal protein S15 [Candidatus Woesearchaeota archaeon]|jgi:small subunit ribosomal protein S15|nr:30S ribosomal protein S15 [Candidatus Woesearchaeota archaeon]MBT4151007.1 30S ribosomal protein S15 [Candidatus Woesearchaeota archaeon]MBT4247224.1 30S ribosomal protein S15 [Candidatus Woesearchaeota archaeon]MBT4433797.1 30S ribosomal protein S15 [Candidatus Woesearchaeota archaeon]MBT7332204.1 30S ribosomal protein S15 [Candidatus Woesearchaeota archaeon]